MFLYLIVCLSVINAKDIPTGQSIMDNPEKPADDTPMTNRNTNNSTIYAGHHYPQINTTNVEMM
jgi:hypothetical protein